ncbi:MAG: glycosyltransferase family 2 protein [Bacteroidota bacterium]
MHKLSVITLALNEEHNIDECLASVRWADELIVVDSGSMDKTVELAKKHTKLVLEVEWLGYGATKNLALQKATGDWVLWLDADERVTPELAEEIKHILKRDDASVVAYDVARRAYFLGKWIRHSGWYPGRVTRLFKRGNGQFTESRVHEQLVIDGRVGCLENDLLHYTDPGLHHYFLKFNRYTSLAAEDLRAAGRSAGLYDLTVRPVFQWVKMYLLRRGFLDGVEGFVLAIVSSLYVFVKYAKLWELQRKGQQDG